MNTPKLPPLPDPKYIWHDADEPGEAELFEFEFAGSVDGKCAICERLYTAEQMQAYAIAAIQAQGLPDGGQLVPKDLTKEMESAAFDVLELPGNVTETGTTMRNRVYNAMLASAPPAPQASVVQQTDIPADIAKILSDNVWDLYATDEDNNSQQANQCEWINCPTRVGGKRCNEQAKPQPQQEPVVPGGGDGPSPLWIPARHAKPQPLSDEQIVPMFRRRVDMPVEGEKDPWFWYAWGVEDGEAAHGIKE